MRTGTPGFIGARLREARQARGYTAIALAELIGVTRSAVSHYEKGEQTPRPEIMRKIEEVLELPPQFFWRIPERGRERKLFFRSMSAATMTARMKAEGRYIWLEEIVRYLREYVHFPTVNFPHFDNIPKDPVQISPELIEELAIETRRFWKLGNGAISNVVWLLENNGAVITRTKLEADTLDAFSEWQEIEGTPYMILGADKSIAVRSRFDAAHELGHIILHRYIDKSRIGKTSTFKLMEQQAHRFAGAFLLPQPAFLHDFFSATLDTFQMLKPKWGISIQMMLYRAQDLGLIKPEQAQRMWANSARRGWRLKEPLDDQLEVEQPRLLRRSFEMLINEGVQTRAQILSALPYSAMDVEELAGLPVGFLEERSAPLSLRTIDFIQYPGRAGRKRDYEGQAEVVDINRNKESKPA
jgi:Zn-dependent peptidase ImmA (M78 family)/transcriptional regulator with XRE-family HTH domain